MRVRSMAPGAARAAVYYAAPTGNEGNPGTLAQPFASMQKGHDRAVAGDTVYFRGGLYKFVGRGAPTRRTAACPTLPS